MTKTISLTISIAVAVIGLAAAAAPTQAASRLMSSSVEGFEYRCEHHGGVFGQDDMTVSCQTPTVPVACKYVTGRQAVCEWPGIANQIAVIRVIGTLPDAYAPSFGTDDDAVGGNNPNPNFDGPDDIVDAPDNDPKPNFDGPDDFQMAP